MSNTETKVGTLRRRRDFGTKVISTVASQVAIRVIRTDEELMIAKTVCQVLGLGCKNKKEN
jgi:acetate kinase